MNGYYIFTEPDATIDTLDSDTDSLGQTADFTLALSQVKTDIDAGLVDAPNNPPIADDDSAYTDEDTPVAIFVLDNDSDPDGDPLTISIVTGPAHGTVVIDDNLTPDYPGDDFVIYIPDENYYGTDEFVYEVDDGFGGADTATGFITILEVNDMPTADDQSVTTDEDDSINIVLTGSDVETSAGGLTFAIVAWPNHGDLFLDGANVIYFPDEDFNGTDSFEFTVTDTGTGHFGDSLTSDPAAVTIDVAPVNDAPVTVDDFVLTENINQFTIAVLTNDYDIDGDTLTVISVTQPSLGTASITGGGTTVTWTHIGILVQPGMTDEFDYTISDGNGGTATATVHITWGEPQLLDGEALAAEAGTTNLTPGQLQPIIAEAIAQLQAAGFKVSALNPAEFLITDLRGALLGLTVQSTIWIDQDAAGRGWYLGGVSGGMLSGEWSGRVDLLTVVTHEFGHILGYASIDAAVTPNDWMTATLGPGVRRLPVAVGSGQKAVGSGQLAESFAPGLSPQGRNGIRTSEAVILERLFAFDFEAMTPASFVMPAAAAMGPLPPDAIFPIDPAHEFARGTFLDSDLRLALRNGLGGSEEVLIGGAGSEILVGETGRDLLVGGFRE